MACSLTEQGRVVASAASAIDALAQMLSPAVFSEIIADCCPDLGAEAAAPQVSARKLLQTPQGRRRVLQVAKRIWRAIAADGFAVPRARQAERYLWTIIYSIDRIEQLLRQVSDLRPKHEPPRPRRILGRAFQVRAPPRPFCSCTRS